MGAQRSAPDTRPQGPSMPYAPSPQNVRNPTDADRFIGRQVRQVRREAGMTQQALSEKLGLTFQQVQKYEAGRSRLPAGRLRDVAIALSKPINYFCEPFPAAFEVRDPERARIGLLRRDAKSSSTPLYGQMIWKQPFRFWPHWGHLAASAGKHYRRNSTGLIGRRVGSAWCSSDKVPLPGHRRRKRAGNSPAPHSRWQNPR
jgi:transcriptional regulator with XRE-family HTH domain